MKTPTVSLPQTAQQTRRPSPAGKNGNDRTVNGFHTASKNRVFTVERNNGVSDNDYTHFSKFAIVLRFTPNGHLSVSAKKPGMTSGNPINPGTIYIEYIEEQNGEGSKLKLTPIASHNGLLKVGHHGDFKDEEPRNQIRAALIDASYEIAREANHLGILPSKSSNLQHDFIKLVEKNASFTIGNNEARRNRNQRSKTDNFRTYLTSRSFGNDRYIDRIIDKHSYADAQISLFSLQEEERILSNTSGDDLRNQLIERLLAEIEETELHLQLPLEIELERISAMSGDDLRNQLVERLLAELPVQLEAHLETIQGLTVTRRSDLRQISKVQLGLIHEDRSKRTWIPHESIKSDTRRKTGKRDDGESFNVNTTKARANAIRRREDAIVIANGSGDYLDGLYEETPKVHTFVGNFTDLHLERSQEYTPQMLEHQELTDALLAYCKENKSPTLVANLFEAFISTYPDIGNSKVLATAINLGIPPTTAFSLAHNLLEVKVSPEVLLEIFNSFTSEGMEKVNFVDCYSRTLQALIKNQASLDFLRLYIVEVQKQATSWTPSIEALSQGAQIISEDQWLGVDYFREYLNVLEETKYASRGKKEGISYPPHKVNEDLRLLIEKGHDPAILRAYIAAYNGFAENESSQRTQSRQNVEFDGKKAIADIG